MDPRTGNWKKKSVVKSSTNLCLINLPFPPPHTRRNHHHLVGGGLSGIGVTLSVGIVIDVLSIVIDVIPVREEKIIGTFTSIIYRLLLLLTLETTKSTMLNIDNIRAMMLKVLMS